MSTITANYAELRGSWVVIDGHLFVDRAYSDKNHPAIECRPPVSRVTILGQGDQYSAQVKDGSFFTVYGGTKP